MLPMKFPGFPLKRSQDSSIAKILEKEKPHQYLSSSFYEKLNGINLCQDANKFKINEILIISPRKYTPKNFCHIQTDIFKKKSNPIQDISKYVIP